LALGAFSPRSLYSTVLPHVLRLQARRALTPKTPGFTVVALATLTLGIGINTAIFGLLDSVLFSPLRYPDADRLVRIWASAPERRLDRTAMSYLRFEEIRRQQDVFDSIAVDTYVGVLLAGHAGGEAERRHFPRSFSRLSAFARKAASSLVPTHSFRVPEKLQTVNSARPVEDETRAPMRGPWKIALL